MNIDFLTPTLEPQNQAAYALLQHPDTDRYWQVERAEGHHGNALLRLTHVPKAAPAGGPAGDVPASAGAPPPPREPVVEPVPMGRRKVILDARPDTVDFRDRMYVPTLVEVPSVLPLTEYLRAWGNRPRVLDQQSEGACTGFGLAAVAHFLLRRRTRVPDRTPVSPRMFYEMARRYDEWSGEDYSGSSARGAMKGWHKHGVCREDLWVYRDGDVQGTLSPDRALDALRRPLGAYFRVNHQDLVAMHSALAEVGIVYATAQVHGGWSRVRADGRIPTSAEVLGGHAFAIVGYDDGGFWIQNSWGPKWGRRGFAHLSYDDWLEHASDVWVARLGAPVVRTGRRAGTVVPGVSFTPEVRRAELQHHTVALGNDGLLRMSGEVGNTRADVERIFAPGGDFDRVTRGWARRRLLIYAHGGLVDEPGALQRVAEYREALLEGGVYPLAFIWKTDLWSTVGNILRDGLARRRPEGLLDAARDFLLDRLDQTLEPIARAPGKAVWDEMKENALRASALAGGGVGLVRRLVGDLVARDPDVEVHVAAHSAGSILLGPWVRDFCSDPGPGIRSVTLWAPACTVPFFREHYVPALDAGRVGRFTLFTLKDPAEQDDHCAHVYHKSLLYLVSNALEERSGFFSRPGIVRPGAARAGTPLLGLERDILHATDLFRLDVARVVAENPAGVSLDRWPGATWVRSPNNRAPGDPFAATARRHGDFDDDEAVVRTTFDLVRGGGPGPGPGPDGTSMFDPTVAGLRSQRRSMGL